MDRHSACHPQLGIMWAHDKIDNSAEGKVTVVTVFTIRMTCMHRVATLYVAVTLVLARAPRQACWNLWMVERCAASRASSPSTPVLKIPSGRSSALPVTRSSHGAGVSPRII